MNGLCLDDVEWGFFDRIVFGGGTNHTTQIHTAPYLKFTNPIREGEMIKFVCDRYVIYLVVCHLRSSAAPNQHRPAQELVDSGKE